MRNLLTARLDFKLLKYNLKITRVYMIIFTVILFITYPSLHVLSILKSDGVNSYAHIQTGLFLTTTALAILSPYIVQQYLNSKKAIDVFHALPIRRSSLFLTNIATAFLLVVIPFSINYFLGLSLEYLFGVAQSAPYISMYIYTLILVLAIQVPNHFVIMNTGTLSNSLIHGFILFLSPFVAFGSLTVFVENFIYGLSSFNGDFLAYLSPAYALNWALVDVRRITLLIFAGFWFVASFVMLCFTFNIYYKRKSERSEDSFTNTRYFPVVVSVFTGLALFGLLSTLSYSYNSSYTTSALIHRFLQLDVALIPIATLFVAYVILDIVRFKSTKNFLKATLHYFMIVAVTLLIGVLLISTRFLGFGLYVPQVSNISSVTLSDSNSSNSVNPTLLHRSNVSISDKTVIEAVRNMHLTALNDTVAPDSDNLIEYMNAPRFEIQYKLNSMVTINRAYPLTRDVLMEVIELSYRTPSLNRIVNPILNPDTKLVLVGKLYSNLLQEYQSVTLDSAFVSKLSLAYIEDTQNIVDSNLLHESSDLKYVLTYTVDANKNESLQYEALVVDSRYTKTLAVLDAVNSTKYTQDVEARYPQYSDSLSTVYLDYSRYWDDGTTSPVSLSLDQLAQRASGSYISTKRVQTIVIHLENDLWIEIPLK